MWHIGKKTTEVLVYGIVGVVAVLLHWAFYAVFLWLGIEVHLSYTLGYALSWLLNFYLNSRFTFHTHANAKRAAGFGITHLCNYLAEMALLEVFLWLGVPKVWAYVPIQIIVVPATFLLVRFVFRSKHFS
ncbi:MAG: GtrA family protein [Prevotella sp.]|nr:GtrA family protein [Prevotella sp.]MCF0209398.1 GtrA family protein [Bacteroidaceae bacterium]